MRVLVCGGRHYADQAVVNETLDVLHSDKPIDVLIHGAATGADTLADKWAKARGVAVLDFPVKPEDWQRQGKAAGPLRNSRMLEAGKPDLVVAFPGHNGTADMVRKARAARVGVISVARSAISFAYKPENI